jgi:Concanavalin A-like lectin/glucanases superfamily
MGLDFPGGVGNRLEVPDPKAEVTGTKQTIAFWAFWNAATINFALAKGSNQFQIFTWNDNMLRTEIAGQQLQAGIPVTTRWSHYAVTRDGTTRILYLDGAQASTMGDTTSVADTTPALAIGGDPLAVYPYNGNLAEVGIWNQALTAAEVLALSKGVSPLMIRLLNLKGYWPLQGVAFPEADLAGTQANAALVGTGIVRVPHPMGGRYAPYGGC